MIDNSLFATDKHVSGDSLLTYSPLSLQEFIVSKSYTIADIKKIP